MRVLHVTHTFLPKIGGAEIFLDRLCERLTTSGVETAVLTEKKRSRPNLTATRSFSVHTWTRSRGRELLFGRTAGEVGVIRRAIRNEQLAQPYDLIHAHYGYPAGVAALPEGRSLGIPVVITSQGGDFFASSSHSRSRTSLWKRVVEAYRQADAVVSISPYTRGEYLSIGVQPERIFDIPNAVDPKELEDPGEPDDPALRPLASTPFVLAIGRLTANKGFDLLIQAWISSKLSHAGYQLVIAGEGRDRQRLQELADRAGKNERILFLGARTGRDKAWLFHRSVYVTMPSREEGMPLVGIETMLAGKPLLASDIQALQLLVSPPQRGLTFPSGDVPALARCLSSMFELDLQSTGRLARDFGQRFTIDRSELAHRKLYETLLVRQRCKPAV